MKSSSFQGTIYTAYVEAAYQFNKYVTAKGSAYFSYQESDFFTEVVTAENVVILAMCIGCGSNSRIRHGGSNRP